MSGPDEPDDLAGEAGEAGEQPDAPKHRLDPDRAVAQQRQRSRRRQMPQPVIDTRPYRWAIGIFGVVLVIILSVVGFATHGAASEGVQPGQKLINFAAPVATSTLSGDANLQKPCRLGYFGARAVNTCLLARQGPLVLGFFVTGATDCEREVDAMQALSKRFPASEVQFAAVAVGSSKSATAKAVRSHHWTIPVAYDADDAIGGIYGVQLCPMLELAYRGGVVKSLLFGNKWSKPTALAAKIRALVAAQSKA